MLVGKPFFPAPTSLPLPTWTSHLRKSAHGLQVQEAFVGSWTDGDGTFPIHQDSEQDGMFNVDSRMDDWIVALAFCRRRAKGRGSWDTGRGEGSSVRSQGEICDLTDLHAAFPKISHTPKHPKATTLNQPLG